ncbi:MAG: cobalamin biosynthesis protein CobD [Chloroflexi bacterium]|nr:cobalamin biosynthesis protein CobD [Chloroflexota bacterium]
MVVALVLDALAGEPPASVHPVVLIGRAIALAERRAPASRLPSLMYGALITAWIVGGAIVAGRAAVQALRVLPPPLALLAEGWLLKGTLSVRALLQAGEQTRACLERRDVDGACRELRALVSRETGGLSFDQLASAAVESLAENASDSIVAPIVYYALGGLPAAYAYRAANTLDAMIGYHGTYEHVGKAAARLDDLLNLVPARLTALLLIAGAALAGGDVGGAARVTWTDAGNTESPNAGWPMSAMAGAVVARLEKVGHYRLGAVLPGADAAAIDHAAEIVKAATILLVAGLVPALIYRRRIASQT